MVAQRVLVADIETNGLNPSVIHCHNISDTEGNVLASGTNLQELKEAVDAAERVVFHNGIGFDYPVLERLENYSIPREKCWDSLVLSRLANPQRKVAGTKKPHGLEGWGIRFGRPKPEQEQWDYYEPDMQHRCDEDVQINVRAFNTIMEELQGFSQESIDLEHEVAWVIQEQMDNGWAFDTEYALNFSAELFEEIIELERKVHERFRPVSRLVRHYEPRYKKDGQLSKVGTNHLGDDWTTVGGPHSVVHFPEFNLGSRQQIAEYLIRFGWEPYKQTEAGNWVVDGDTLEHVDIPEAKLIKQYLDTSKIRSMITNWLGAVREDGRIYGYVNSNGAVTGRMTHSEPNLAQVPAKGELGKRCRRCFVVPKGKKLVGTDADGLELRMLAHYMNDLEYIKAVVEGDKSGGTDAHSVNMRAAGLSDRDTAKTFIYAFLYGAGGAKIAAIAGLKGAQAGNRLKDKFLAKTLALKDLIARVKMASRRGWLKGLDGRKIYVRSEHAALNTLLQGAGAIIMKKALVILHGMVKERGLDVKFVGNIHDEFQAEVADCDVEEYSKLASDSIRLAGEYFNLRCPLAGSSDVGTNWSETH